MESAIFHRGRPSGDRLPLVVAVSIALHGGFYPFDPDEESHPEPGSEQRGHPGSILFGVLEPVEAAHRKKLFLRQLNEWAKASKIAIFGTPSHSLYGDDLPSRQTPELVPTLYFQERRGWNYGENQILYADGDLCEEDLEALRAGILEVRGQRNSWSNVVVDADGFFAALRKYIQQHYADPKQPSDQQLVDALLGFADGRKLTVAEATNALRSIFPEPEFKLISSGKARTALAGAKLGVSRGRPKDLAH